MNILSKIKTRVKKKYFDHYLTIDQAKRVTPQAFLENIGVHLAHHCNLHCYSCDNFSQLSKPGYYDIEIFERDLERLRSITNGMIREFYLLGGEPLLNKQCASYFNIVRKYFHNTEIHMITNAILLPKQNQHFWDSARTNKVHIRPTKYPIEIDWEAIKNRCKEENVALEFFNDENVEKHSFKTSLDPEGKSIPFESFVNCHRANACTQLYNGKIYPCPPLAYIDIFNEKFSQNLKQTPADYIDIYQDDITYEKILNFLARPVPFCRYCKTKDTIYQPWLRSKKTLDEYFS